MIHPETLKTVTQAFHLVKAEQGLSSWDLDSELTGEIFEDENSADGVIIHLGNENAARTHIHIELLDVIKREGSITVEGVAKEITKALQEHRLISY